MSLQNRLILFFFVTSLGSALSSIASFLSIENYFESIILLGFALSVRTFASAIFSYVANDLIHMVGVRYSLLLSQLFGCLALLVLFLGFNDDNYALTICGIILTGLPSTFVAILMTIVLRISSANTDLFRKYSGRRELVFGVAMLSSSILAPILLWKFGLNYLLLMDGMSYLIGFALLYHMQFSSHIPDEKQERPLSIKKSLMISKSAQSFMLKTSASLLLAGLLPLLASSSKIQFTENMPILLRQWLWVIEDITAISASLIYLSFSIFRNKNFLETFLMLSAAWLIIPFVFTGTYYSIIMATIIICLLIDFSGQKFRDDLIVSAGNDSNLIKAYSALSQLQRNFIFFISPILLSVLFSYFSMPVYIAVILGAQLAIYITYKFSITRS